MPKLTLVAAEHSYFSAKARSYLRFKGRQGEFFNEALATSDMYRQAILPLVGVNFIPVLLVHDEDGVVKDAIQDTSLIIDYVERTYPALPSIHPTTPKQLFVSYLIELWADEWLKMPAMHYRWSFLDVNERYLVHEWGRVNTPLLSAEKRDAIVLNTKAKGPTFTAMKNTLPLLGITDKTSAAIEQSFVILLDALEAHFRLHPYLLGGRPCLGDFALIGPMYAHLYRDPKPSSLLRSRAPAFCEYIERMNGLRPAYEGVVTFDATMKRLVPPASGTVNFGQVPLLGEYFANDEIPATLLPVLQTVFEEHIPVLLSTARELESFFATANPSPTQQLPRTTGFHSFTIRGSEQEQRLAYPYDIWMLQRCMDSIVDPSVVHRFIESFPYGRELLALLPKLNADMRLRLVQFKLYRDPNNPPRLVQSKL